MRARPRFGRALLALLCAISSGCISVQERETRRIEAAALQRRRLEGSVQRSSASGLEVTSVVYKPALIPLGDFFRRMARGEFQRAFRSARLRYSPSNADDRALKTLIAHGIAPAYVEARNAGDSTVDLAGLELRLADSVSRLEPIPLNELPREFEEFNPKAAAANVYNTGAAVVGCAAFLAVLVGSLYAGGNPLAGAGVLGELPNLASDLDGDVYNALYKTADIDYDGLLWKPRRLAPGERSRGLVFFRAGRADWTELALSAKLAPASR